MKCQCRKRPSRFAQWTPQWTMRWTLSAVCLIGLAAANGFAGEDPAYPEQLRKLIDRLERVEQELDALKRKAPAEVPADPKEQRVVMALESPLLGSVYYGGPQQKRFFVAKLLLINLTSQAVAADRKDLTLQMNGQALELAEVPQNIQYHSFQVGRQQLQMREVLPPKEIRLASGAVQNVWVFFNELPAGSQIPPLTLQLKVGEKKYTLDVNAHEKQRLALEVNRMGPRGCLGFCRIAGELNSVNVGSLVDELDALSLQKVGRIVLAWSEGAVPVEGQLRNWLVTSATSAGRSEPGQLQYPGIPATIRELHVAGLPGEEDGEQAQELGPTPPRVHHTEAAAVAAALRTAFEVLPRDELVDAIEKEQRLARAAALIHGAGRLQAEQLPIVLKYADDADPLIQNAALTALRHFGEPAVIAKLVAYVHRNQEPLAGTAIASLAGSRYEAAHQALLEVLTNEPPESKRRIVGVLAQYPRPIWSEAIYQFVKDPRSGLNQEALRALQQVGHPQLTPVLKDALADGDAALRQLAFGILITRNDPESERIALEFTLERMKTEAPDASMLTLLNRVKDQRAVPLLLQHFDQAQDKSSLIQALGMIGDQTVAEIFLKKYPTLQSHEKAQILTALSRWKSPEFQRMAREALQSGDSQIVSVATQGLVEDGGAEAIRMLVDALQTVTNQQSWHYICNALGMLATPAARAALVAARDSTNKEKRQYAVNALQQIRQRSPAYQYIFQAQALMQDKNWKEAQKHYTTAIQIDPELPEAYVGRADCFIRQDKFTDAGKDYSKALELDPYNSQAVTGVCITMVIDGKPQEAIDKLEASREKFSQDPLFAYNSACVYGRAHAAIQANEKVEKREELLKQYGDKAVRDLQQSIRLGFRDFTWLNKDPDLTSLHGDARFQKLPETVPDAEQAEDTEADDAAEGR